MSGTLPFEKIMHLDWIAQASENSGFYSIFSPVFGGQFLISEEARTSVEKATARELLLIRRAGWRRAHGYKSPIIDEAFIEKSKGQRFPTFRERTLKLLSLIRNETTELGRDIKVFDSEAGLTPFGYQLLAESLAHWDPEIGSSQELSFLLNFLREDGALNRLSSNEGVSITCKGILELEKMSEELSLSQQCFVAMWFDPSMDAIWEDGFAPAIERSGYEPVRIDKLDHPNKIDDEIIAQIRQSRFIVADFTCPRFSDDVFVHRGGVYYEAGFAMGLGLPVIWTVRETALAGLHFDTRQFPHLVWKTADDLRSTLQSRIEALIGPGPLRS